MSLIPQRGYDIQCPQSKSHSRSDRTTIQVNPGRRCEGEPAGFQSAEWLLSPCCKSTRGGSFSINAFNSDQWPGNGQQFASTITQRAYMHINVPAPATSHVYRDLPMPKNPTIAIVYASIHHGNTRKVAELLAAELSADLFSVDQVRSKGVNLDRYDLVGLGSGVYFGRHHASLRRLVESWSQSPRSIFIFSTAGLPFLRWIQHGALRRRLIRKSCHVVAEFCCRGWDTVGPLWLMGGINREHPDTKDMNRAKVFARHLKASL